MNRPETKTERRRKFYGTNQVNEKKHAGLLVDFHVVKCVFAYHWCHLWNID
jgi:hypothetical protein